MRNGPDIISVEEIAANIPDGALMGVPANYAGVPMAATRELIRRKARDLSLYCVPMSTMQADILIGAGCVSAVEGAAVTLGEYGLAPCFSRGIEDGSLTMRDSTCPALHAQLIAAEKGIPFMPLRGLIGSDIDTHRPDWKVTDNPFSDKDDPIVLLPAVRPDVALFHGVKADRNGNVWIGRQRELATVSRAAERTYVTVEEIVDTDFFESEETAAGSMSALYIDAIAEVPQGAWPVGLQDQYGEDGAAMKAYARAAQTQDGFDGWLTGFLDRSRTVAA